MKGGCCLDETATDVGPRGHFFLRLRFDRLAGGLISLVIACATSASAQTEAIVGAPLTCGYSTSMSLKWLREVSRRDPQRTQFELPVIDGLVRPDFCDEVVQSISADNTYFVSCRSGEGAATITHDIVISKRSGEIVTIMNFFSDNDWVSKVAHMGVCELE